MHEQDPFGSDIPSPASRIDYFFGRLKQLQIRYPRLIGDVRRGQLVIDIEFFLEDLAIDGAHAFLDEGITAVHRMSSAKVLSLQLPSVIDQHQEQLAIDHFDRFLQKCTRRASLAAASEPEKQEPASTDPA